MRNVVHLTNARLKIALLALLGIEWVGLKICVSRTNYAYFVLVELEHAGP